MAGLPWVGAGAAVACLAAAAGAPLFFRGGDSAAAPPAEADRLVAAAQLLAKAPPEQQAALADGVVTIDELNAAAEAAAGCIAASGFEGRVSVPANGMRIATMQWSLPGVGRDDEAGLGAANAKLAACNAKFFDDVDMLWQVQHQPDEQQLREMYGWLQSCVASGEALEPAESAHFTRYSTAPAGLVMSVPPMALARYTACAAEYEARTGFVAPSPGLQ